MQFLKAKLIFLISIHALREEGDLLKTLHPDIYAISIHALREEGDIPLLVLTSSTA